jgi:general secretion pathway protein G
MTRARAGFTLIEIMVVIIIISILATMVLPKLSGKTEQARTARAKSDIAAIEVALDLYELDIGAYPEDLQKLLTDTSEGWSGPYLKKKVAKDPWGHEYQYSASSEHGQDYDLFSPGRNGVEGDEDDIANWE